MSEVETKQCGSAVTVAVILIAAAFLIVVGAAAMDNRKMVAALEQQAKQLNAQGQQVVNARQQYFVLYADLVQLAQSDREAAAIITKYGVQMQQPAATK